jgi:uncharacterized membrane protein
MHALADGIFAIALTLLVLARPVPERSARLPAYHASVPAGPLNGPTRSLVIQPP